MILRIGEGEITLIMNAASTGRGHVFVTHGVPPKALFSQTACVLDTFALWWEKKLNRFRNSRVSFCFHRRTSRVSCSTWTRPRWTRCSRGSEFPPKLSNFSRARETLQPTTRPGCVSRAPRRFKTHSPGSLIVHWLVGYQGCTNGSLLGKKPKKTAQSAAVLALCCVYELRALNVAFCFHQMSLREYYSLQEPMRAVLLCQKKIVWHQMYKWLWLADSNLLD